MTVDICSSYLFFLLSALFSTHPGSALVSIIPYHNVVHSIGEAVVLPCPTTKNIPAGWTFIQANKSSLPFHDGMGVLQEIPNGFRSRFIISKSADDAYNLTIANVQLEDAGIYTCTVQDGSAAGIHKTVRLVVLLEYPGYSTTDSPSKRPAASLSSKIFRLLGDRLSQTDGKVFLFIVAFGALLTIIILTCNCYTRLRCRPQKQQLLDDTSEADDESCDALSDDKRRIWRPKTIPSTEKNLLSA